MVKSDESRPLRFELIELIIVKNNSKQKKGGSLSNYLFLFYAIDEPLE